RVAWRWSRATLSVRGMTRSGVRDGAVALEEAEGVALCVLAPREPADAGDRLLVLGTPSELACASDARVDVVGVEVDDRASRTDFGRVHGATGLASGPGHVIGDPGHVGGVPFPTEQARVERRRPRVVLRGHLPVDQLSCLSFPQPTAISETPTNAGASR